MYKKLLPLISLLLIAVFVLTACAPKATPTPEAPAQPPAAEPTKAEPTKAPAPTEPPAPQGVTGTITLWHAWKENEIESLNEVIAAFQALNPEVKFDVLYVPFDDLKGKYETATATGGGPTVLIGAADWGPGFYDAALVADLSADLDADFLATINEAALGAVQYKDALIGLPQTLKGVVMFRNKTIVPEAATSLDDLIAKAKAAASGDVQGATLEYGFFFSAAHLDAVGGKLMEANGDPAFNDAKGVEWVNNILKFKDAGTYFNYSDDDVNLFKAGKSGVIIDGTWNMSSLAEAIGAENLTIDPWPAGMSGYVQTENIYLNENATGDDRAAGLEFIKFFLSAEAQSLLADATKAGHIPAVKGVEVTDPLMKAAADAFAGGAAFPVIPEMGAYWDPMNNALKKAVDEGVDPAVALQEAYDLVVAKVKEIRGQ
jgi:arabinogalactan oligomer/maltooligosaccharide transport system substrate-binding protein